MLDNQKIEEIIKHYKENSQTPKKINTPEFSIALGCFLMDIIQTEIYKILFGEVISIKIDEDSFGFCSTLIKVRNDVTKESHTISYKPSSFRNSEIVGEFSFKEIIFKESNKIEKCYLNLHIANKNNPYIETIFKTNDIEELLDKSTIDIVYSTKDNPFIGLRDYSRCSGLNYLDTLSNSHISFDKKPEHKAIIYNSLLGVLAYLHYKTPYDDFEMDNTLYLSSVGVVPPLRKRGIAKNMYQLANEYLGFNENTIIKRTRPGRLAPPEFTHTVSKITEEHKPIYLNHELSRFDFKQIQGFQELSRIIQAHVLKKANEQYEETLRDIVNKKRNNFDLFNKKIIALDKAIERMKEEIIKHFFSNKIEKQTFIVNK